MSEFAAAGSRRNNNNNNNNNNKNKQKEPFVLIENACSYRELLWLVEQLTTSILNNNNTKTFTSTSKPTKVTDIYDPNNNNNNNDHNDNNNTNCNNDHHNDDKLSLPPELIHRIANFLTVNRVDPKEVTAVRCSSSDGRNPLKACLEENTSTWWISAANTMPRGQGNQFVEFQLAPTSTTTTITTTTTTTTTQPTTFVVNSTQSSSTSSSQSSTAASNVIIINGNTNSTVNITINSANSNKKSKISPPIFQRQIQQQFPNVRRLEKFSIEIPPLPMGPLSVRTLRLESKVGLSLSSPSSTTITATGTDTTITTTTTTTTTNSSSSGTWKAISPIWTIENKTGWQTFELEQPVDAAFVRVVCLTNQISVFLRPRGEEDDDNDDDDDDDDRNNPLTVYSCVGFYHVKFE